MLILNFGMLVAFVWISFVQISKTNEALKTADTSNAYTKESIDFTKIATLSSDSSTKSSIAIAETSLAIAQKTFEVNKLTMITSNTAYVSAHAKMFKFNDSTLIVKIIFKNAGKTPALNLSFDASRKTLHAFEEPPERCDNYSESGIIIAPNDSIYILMSTERGYVKSTYKDISWYRRRVDVWGNITYDDVYGLKYRVDFYFTYRPFNNTFEAPEGGRNTYKKITQKGLISP